ncbi:MAG: transketolase [Candidatus Omnitrophica bacterium]|nr:transketolase [Candidatus Omnitrophota bacterium]
MSEYIKNLEKKADQIREEIISVAVKNQAGHIAPSLSCVDILVALYYKIMRYKKTDPYWEDRDRLIFSKGHGCYALYAILANLGILPKNKWQNFYTAKSSLCGCVERNLNYGLEASCGSLGHGLSMAVGIAFAAKLLNKKYRTFCLVGDGELQEGSNWEALQFAVKYDLSNLLIIVDKNRLQAMDFIVNVLDKKETDLLKRLKGFGLFVNACCGHNIKELIDCIEKSLCAKITKPKVIVAKTIKGFGLKCMENIAKFHFRVPTEEELKLGKTYAKKLSQSNH